MCTVEKLHALSSAHVRRYEPDRITRLHGGTTLRVWLSCQPSSFHVPLQQHKMRFELAALKVLQVRFPGHNEGRAVGVVRTSRRFTSLRCMHESAPHFSPHEKWLVLIPDSLKPASALGVVPVKRGGGCLGLQRALCLLALLCLSPKPCELCSSALV